MTSYPHSLHYNNNGSTPPYSNNHGHDGSICRPVDPKVHDHDSPRPSSSRASPIMNSAYKTIKAHRRNCSVAGCKNGVVQGGVCVSHGAKRRLCRFPGCTKNSKNAGLCSKHGPPRKRCDQEGCTNVAVRGGRCKSHGAWSKVCSVQDCNKIAAVGGMCKRHHFLSQHDDDLGEDPQIRVGASTVSTDSGAAAPTFPNSSTPHGIKGAGQCSVRGPDSHGSPPLGLQTGDENPPAAVVAPSAVVAHGLYTSQLSHHVTSPGINGSLAPSSLNQFHQSNHHQPLPYHHNHNNYPSMSQNHMIPNYYNGPNFGGPHPTYNPYMNMGLEESYPSSAANPAALMLGLGQLKSSRQNHGPSNNSYYR
ncbi:hypothetical protein ACHAXS_003358 [Conticribra weissflogii]